MRLSLKNFANSLFSGDVSKLLPGVAVTPTKVALLLEKSGGTRVRDLPEGNAVEKSVKDALTTNLRENNRGLIERLVKESLAKGKPVYMPPRYMKTDCAAAQLLEAAKETKDPSYDENTPCFGLARIGTST